MLKITLLCVVLACFLEISSGKPVTDASAAEEMLKLFGNADDIREDKLSPAVAEVLTEVAKENDLSLQESLLFMRLGMKAIQNQREGKAATEGLTKEGICAELNTAPRGTANFSHGTSMYNKVAAIRRSCESS